MPGQKQTDVKFSTKHAVPTDPRKRPDATLVEIEMFANGSIFEPRRSLAHGGFRTDQSAREPWIAERKESAQKCANG